MRADILLYKSPEGVSCCLMFQGQAFKDRCLLVPFCQSNLVKVASMHEK